MSTIFNIVCVVLLTGVIAAVASPFWRKDGETSDPTGREAEDDQERADLLIERDVLQHSLRELDVELAQGRLEQEDYQRLQATDERRLLEVLTRLDALADPVPQPLLPEHLPRKKRAWGSAIVTGLVVASLSMGIYGFLQWRMVSRLVDIQAGMAAQAPDPAAMVARLEARLKENPDDVQGQLMAGRSYMVMDRMDDAKKAYLKVLDLSPRNREAHYNLGVIMIEQRQFDDPNIFQAALEHFDVVLVDLPNQPGVNWYKGLALWYLKRHREAEECWATAYNNLPPDSPDADFVKQALTKLRNGETPI